MKRFLLILMLLLGSAFPKDVEIPDGAWGVWEVSETGTVSPLYFAQGTGQSIVDRENAACVRNFGEGYAIFDHADSEVDGGTWNVNEMTVGGSAFLHRDDGIKEYRCTAIWFGYNDGFSLISDVDGKAIRPRAKGDIVCCSCATLNGAEVYVAYFKLLEQTNDS